MVQIMPANPVTDWFTDLANSLAESLNNARVEIVKSLVKTALPSLEELRNGWFMAAFGGTMGLANLLVTTVAVLVTLFMILSPNRNHSLRIRRTVTSLLYTSIFGFLFFRLYSLAYELTQAASQGMINIATGKGSSTIVDAANLLVEGKYPADVWVKVIVALLGFVLTYLAYAVAYANVIAVFFIGIFYVLVLVLRPLSEKFNGLFHLFNSGLATTLVTPLIMVFGLVLPFAVNRYIPFGSSSMGLGLATIVGSAIALFGPIYFATWAFRKSSHVFGSVEAQISGRVDIDSMPGMSSSEMMGESVKESATKSFLSTFGAGAATAGLSQSDDLKGDLRKLAVEAGGAAAAATGHPWAAAALSTVDTTLSKEKRQHQAEQGPQGEAPPPVPQHMPPPPPSQAPRPPAPETPQVQSPIVEFPGRKS